VLRVERHSYNYDVMVWKKKLMSVWPDHMN